MSIIDVLIENKWEKTSYMLKKPNICVSAMDNEHVLGYVDINEIPEEVEAQLFGSGKLIKAVDIELDKSSFTEKTYYVLYIIKYKDLHTIVGKKVSTSFNIADNDEDTIFVGVYGKYLAKIVRGIYGVYRKKKVTVNLYSNGLALIQIKTKKYGTLTFLYPVVMSCVTDDLAESLKKKKEVEQLFGGTYNRFILVGGV